MEAETGLHQLLLHEPLDQIPEKGLQAVRGPAPDGVKAAPLSVLGVPADADSDPAVDGLFQKMFGSAMVFVMGHEMGHLFHGHSANVDAARSRTQESEADALRSI